MAFIAFFTSPTPCYFVAPYFLYIDAATAPYLLLCIFRGLQRALFILFDYAFIDVLRAIIAI